MPNFKKDRSRFQMKGWSAFTKQTDPEKKLQPSEHKDTEITSGNKVESITDINDRIQFIEEDIFNQDGKMTPTQRTDLATLEQKLRELKTKK